MDTNFELSGYSYSVLDIETDWLGESLTPATHLASFDMPPSPVLVGQDENGALFNDSPAREENSLPPDFSARPGEELSSLSPSNEVVSPVRSQSLLNDLRPTTAFASPGDDPALVLVQETQPQETQPLEATSAGELEFVFNATAETPQEVIDGFIAAGELWSSLLTDDVTITVDIGFEPLGAGVLGATGSAQGQVDYEVIRDALVADGISGDDLTVAANLPGGSSVDLLINNTSQNGGSSSPYLDSNDSTNNTNVTVTSANLKALGLIDTLEDMSDAQITFSSDFNWDFDRSDGISSSAFDFVGVATHEIGHALGFISGVDDLDVIAGMGFDPLISENSYAPAVMDLLRFSDLSADLSVIDFTADAREKFFSIDGGQTAIVPFSTGVSLGDGNQASHWQDSLNIGLMDPTLAPGELGDITAFDQQLFDVIGWDLA